MHCAKPGKRVPRMPCGRAATRTSSSFMATLSLSASIRRRLLHRLPPSSSTRINALGSDPPSAPDLKFSLRKVNLLPVPLPFSVRGRHKPTASLKRTSALVITPGLGV